MKDTMIGVDVAKATRRLPMVGLGADFLLRLDLGQRNRQVQYRGEDVVQTLERICGKVGYPKTIRVDNVLSAEQNGDLVSRSRSIRATGCL